MYRYLKDLREALEQMGKVREQDINDVFFRPNAYERSIIRSATIIAPNFVGEMSMQPAIAAIDSLVKKLENQRAKPLTAAERAIVRAALYPEIRRTAKEFVRDFLEGKYHQELLDELGEVARDLEEVK